MQEMKIRYAIAKPKEVLSEIFTIKQIEFGEAAKWLAENNALEGQIKRDFYIESTDKNGVEIYEGDIVKCTYPLYIEKSRSIFEVCWDDLNKKIALRRKRIKESDDYVGREDGFIYITRPNVSEFRRIYEVIGNIHENPELLESTLKKQ
jgi:uncharacterized phage protein (TIGR01671 family)